VRHYLEKTLHKKRAGGMAQGIGPEIKPPVLQKKKKNQQWLTSEILAAWEAGIKRTAVGGQPRQVV
jgi:hypothetical protein